MALIPLNEKPVAASAALADFFVVVIDGRVQRATVETIADAMTAAQLEVVKNAIQKAEATITSAEDTIVKVETEKNKLNEVFVAADEAKQAAVEAKNHADRAKPKVLVVTCNTNASFTTIEAVSATYAQMDSFVRAGGCVLLLCKYGSDMLILTSTRITAASGISFQGSTDAMRVVASVSSNDVWAVSSQPYPDNDIEDLKNNAVLHKDERITDANLFIDRFGYAKTGDTTRNLPTTGLDAWGIILFLTENASAKVGTQIFYQVAGANKGRIWVRTHNRDSFSGWKPLSDFSGAYADLTGKPETFAPSAHKQSASSITTGEFDGVVYASDAPTYANCIRNSTISDRGTAPQTEGDVVIGYNGQPSSVMAGGTVYPVGGGGDSGVTVDVLYNHEVPMGTQGIAHYADLLSYDILAIYWEFNLEVATYSFPTGALRRFGSMYKSLVIGERGYVFTFNIPAEGSTIQIEEIAGGNVYLIGVKYKK